MTGTLFVVGTPIGNLGDLSERARSTLATVNAIAAEDTRHTGRMLARLGIERSAELVSFFEGNEAERVPVLLRRLRRGEDVALVCDAGMPAISDPGYRLVASCVDAGVPVDVVPGPSAVVAALAISGLPTDRFAFEGFLPRSGGARAERLADIAADPRTVVLFESPRRTRAALADLLAAAGNRRVVVAREMTKLHREVLRGSLSDLVAGLADRELKGEIVIVLEGAADAPPATLAEALAMARASVEAGARKRDAAREAARRTRLTANEVYAALIADAEPRTGS